MMADEPIPLGSYELGYIELSNSPIFSKISEADRRQYVEASLTAGKQAANEKLLVNQSIFDLIASEDRIQLKLCEQKRMTGASALRGEINFTKQLCTITVYQESVRSLFGDYRNALPFSLRLTEKQALAVHLAHEYFHFLEFASGQTVAQRLPKVRLPAFLIFTQQVEVTACSEIAAHAFAKQFCHLSVLPNYYDLHFVQQRSLVKKVQPNRRTVKWIR